MLEYQQVGELIGAEPAASLLLPADRPLSYLRVSGAPGRGTSLSRALLEQRATEFRRRIPLACLEEPEPHEVSAILARFQVSPVFPVLRGQREEDGGAVAVCWLDRVQALAVSRSLSRGLVRSNRTLRVAGLRISPVFATGSAEAETAPQPGESWQYWNSEWEFATLPAGSDGWWRVRPNNRRKHDRPLGFLPSSDARGTSAVCLHPETMRSLGSPRYLVVEHPFRLGTRQPVLALADEALVDKPKGLWERTLFLDRTAREVLGICDGEFCLAYPWLQPRRQVLRRYMRDRYVGSRTIAAGVRTSARADLEKPACRLTGEALAAIGGQPNEFVTIENLAGAGDRWTQARISQRVLQIDESERADRRSWETTQTWDERSVFATGAASDGPGLDPEGFVDCAETLGVQPPYPTIYLNYHARSELEVGLCQPVEVRVSVLNRLGAEVGNLVWLVLIGLIGTVIALLSLPIGWIVAVLGGTLLFLLAIRALRATR